MTKVFFTYVWGPPGNPAWPLTFATKAAPSHARKVLTEGDLVFAVGTKGEPTEEAHKGRVVGAFRVSNLEVNTQDYDLPRKRENPEYDSVTRFPFALQPDDPGPSAEDRNPADDPHPPGVASGVGRPTQGRAYLLADGIWSPLFGGWLRKLDAGSL
jgi:hypothetical protein